METKCNTLTTICTLLLLKLSKAINIPAGCNRSIHTTHEIDRNNPYSLWPGLISPYSLKHGTTLVGLEEAIRTIWYIQHPPDCSKAKYIIGEGWWQGFGSEIHGHGVTLGLAVETNRVFLQEEGWTWRYRNDFCEKEQQIKGWECYYEPLSKCTLKDAMLVMAKSKIIKERMLREASKNITENWTASEDSELEKAVIKYGKKAKWTEIASHLSNKGESQCYTRWFHYLEKHIKSTRPRLSKADRDAMDRDDQNLYDHRTKHHGVITLNRINRVKQVGGRNSFDIVHPEYHDNVLIISNDLSMNSQKVVPTQFTTNILRNCSTLISEQYYYFWWRAISATYLLRPNLKTLELIEQHRDVELKERRGNCVSMYIRHGDKVWREMKMVPFHFYADAAASMLNNQSVFAANNTTKFIYFATEDKNVMAEAMKWGLDNNIVVRHSKLLSTLLHSDVVHRPADLERHLPADHDYEYFSYLLHLSEILSCDAFVCTIPSNYCRLIDELKGTIGGNANGLNADVSSETCQRPPCIRSFGLANYEGPIYDPKTRIW